jgi:hypothetical protein
MSTKRNRSTRWTSCPSAAWFTTDPTKVNRNRTRGATVGSRRLTAWGTARLWFRLNSECLEVYNKNCKLSSYKSLGNSHNVVFVESLAMTRKRPLDWRANNCSLCHVINYLLNFVCRTLDQCEWIRSFVLFSWRRTSLHTSPLALKIKYFFTILSKMSHLQAQFLCNSIWSI